MQNIDIIPVLQDTKSLSWWHIVWESVLAIGGASGVTGFIALFQLYPRIPNISIIYLLLILVLASLYGRYASLLASVVAFLAFDFFLVPPLYLFTINRWEEWVALFVFLITALLTSQLTLTLRQSTALARVREREARILYELIRLTNSHEARNDQLEIIALAFTRVFAAWGVRHCAILLPDEQGALKQLVTTALANEFTLDYEERLLAVTAMVQGKMLEKRFAATPDELDSGSHMRLYKKVRPITILRFLPLKADEQTFGVLCLHITDPAPWFDSTERMEADLTHSISRLSFFWTFVEQVSSLLERAHLRSVIYH
ncbi:DUF4118 domain-containing protein [Dictyobacter arantiisoli]|uniref:Sensor protein KdpD transmembrane domain-containing protein n=1 Tax=Dictyobacter arantiisoli TaxID=2014874 RepID=A0A5A5T6U8_9CHLR|nr:DUF4118 domain-containing protein [Dictyobacter arantiisoli]GCF06906.1 hypothetical protein KDI_04700 [Dictyobacter arantiisoli]